jgi:flagellar hook-length control protein FliK
MRSGDSQSGAGLAAALATVGAGAAPSPSIPPAGVAAPASADAGAAGLAPQVAARLVGALGAGRLDVVLRLHPPELGDLNVRLEVSGRAVTAWFDSPLPQVQQALSQNMGQLHAGFASAGYALNSAWIGGDAWTPRGWTAPQTPRPPRLVLARAGATAPADIALPAAGPGVSLYV